MNIPPGGLGQAAGAQKTSAPKPPQFGANQDQKQQGPEGPQKPQQKDDGGLLKQLLAFAGSATRSSDSQTAEKAKGLVEQAGGAGKFSAMA